MTEKEKQERAEALKDQLADCLFQNGDGEVDESILQKLLDELDELELLAPIDPKGMLERFWNTFEERIDRMGRVAK